MEKDNFDLKSETMYILTFFFTVDMLICHTNIYEELNIANL